MDIDALSDLQHVSNTETGVLDLNKHSMNSPWLFFYQLWLLYVNEELQNWY